jgi:multidrug efflux pump subunit AcrA (membrane-fusion protein)
MARSRFWRRYRGWIAVGVLVVIAAAVYFFVKGSKPTTQATTYQTEQAANGTLSVTVAGAGNLAVRDAVDVTAKTSGTVLAVKTAVGKTVKKGAPLLMIDGADAERTTAQALASKRQAAQQVDQASLALTKAKNDLATLRDSATQPDSKVTSAQITEAKQQVTVAEAGLSTARAQYTSAKLSYQDALAAEADLTVKAPCDGVVWAVNVSAGDTVTGSSSSSNSNSGNSSASSSGNSSAAPVVIAAGGKLGAELSINEVDITSIKLGQEAELTFDAVPDLSLTGKVDEISRDGTVSQGVVTYSVWVTLDVNDKRLKTGMSISATIVTAVARDVLLVSNSAVKTATDGSTYVQVLDSGASTPRDVAVTTGLADDSQTEITSGLQSGVAVVTRTITASSSSSSSSGSSSSGTSNRFEGGGQFIFGGGGPGAGGN